MTMPISLIKNDKEKVYRLANRESNTLFQGLLGHNKFRKHENREPHAIFHVNLRIIQITRKAKNHTVSHTAVHFVWAYLADKPWLKILLLIWYERKILFVD